MHPTTFDYLQPTADQRETMRVLRINFRMLHDVIEKLVPDGRYKSLVMTALEESAMWANKGVTRCSNGAPRIEDSISASTASRKQRLHDG